MAKLSLGRIDMGDHDHDWFVVMSRLGGRSIRANVTSVLGYYVRRRKEEYKEILKYTAQKYGLTEDECFKRVLNEEDLGEPIDDSTIPTIKDEG